jgi:hypothetical protein
VGSSLNSQFIATPQLPIPPSPASRARGILSDDAAAVVKARAMAEAQTDGSYPAGGACPARRHQSRRSIRADRAPLCRTVEPLLEAPLRIRSRIGTHRVRRRWAAAGVGSWRDERDRAAEPRHRRTAARRVPRGLARAGGEDRSVSPRDRRVRWRDALSDAVEDPGRRPCARHRTWISARDGARRPHLRPAQPERTQRELYLRGDAGRVPRTAERDGRTGRAGAAAQGERSGASCEERA